MSERANASQLQGLPLAEAKLINDSGTGKTYLRKGRKLLGRSSCRQRREEWEHLGEVTLQTPGSVGNEGEEIPMKLVVKTVVGLSVLLQPIEVHSGAEIHLQRSPHWCRWMPKGSCNPVSSQC